MAAANHHRYLVKSLLHAARVLECFTHPAETLRLREIVDRSGLTKGTCFRLLYTLHHCGFVEKVGENQYKLMWLARAKKRWRVGYAAQGQDTSFTQEVLAGLVRAAEREQLELIVVDNRYQPKVALRNADHLIRERVDLVIEFQTDESVAPAISAKCLEAGIPMIAIDIPHPGATYFGANNYEAGLLAGRWLGKWALKHWAGEVHEILLVELGRAGSLPRARMRGALDGIRESLRETEPCPVSQLDGDGQFKTAQEEVRRYLRVSKARRVLMAAANDPSALGALRAFEEAGRAAGVAAVGQNAEPEARAELRQARTPLIGSVAFFPERYGDGLVRLALDILARKALPPAVFVKHRLITRDNVDRFYPNDTLFGIQGFKLPHQPSEAHPPES